MNRRDAIKALTALPGVASIAAAPVRPKDVIVVECDMHVSCEMAARMKETLTEVWPGQKIVILDKGHHLKIVEGSET